MNENPGQNKESLAPKIWCNRFDLFQSTQIKCNALFHIDIYFYWVLRCWLRTQNVMFYICVCVVVVVAVWHVSNTLNAAYAFNIHYKNCVLSSLQAILIQYTLINCLSLNCRIKCYLTMLVLIRMYLFGCVCRELNIINTIKCYYLSCGYRNTCYACTLQHRAYNNMYAMYRSRCFLCFTLSPWILNEMH